MRPRRSGRRRRAVPVAVAATIALLAPTVAAADARVAGAMSSRRQEATDLGRADPGRTLHISVGLALRNRAELEAFLADVQDPRSPRYRQFLTPDEFNALYAPTPAEEEAVVAHLRAHGLRVTARFPNRLVVGVVGSSAAVERTFSVEIHDVLFR